MSQLWSVRTQSQQLSFDMVRWRCDTTCKCCSSYIYCIHVSLGIHSISVMTVWMSMSVSVSLFKLIFIKEKIQKPFHMPYHVTSHQPFCEEKKSYHSLDDNWLWTDKCFKDYVYFHEPMVLLIKKGTFIWRYTSQTPNCEVQPFNTHLWQATKCCVNYKNQTQYPHSHIFYLIQLLTCHLNKNTGSEYVCACVCVCSLCKLLHHCFLQPSPKYSLSDQDLMAQVHTYVCTW